MEGFLTKDRYTCATVFVYHNINLSYVHLQKSTSAKYTLEAKEAFEMFSRQRGVWIKNYHSDNGTFAANNWVRDCYTKGQGLTFLSVNAHHQNGKGRSAHPTTPRDGKNLHDTCKQEMSRCQNSQSMAIRHKSGK